MLRDRGYINVCIATFQVATRAYPGTSSSALYFWHARTPHNEQELLARVLTPFSTVHVPLWFGLWS